MSTTLGPMVNDGPVIDIGPPSSRLVTRSYRVRGMGLLMKPSIPQPGHRGAIMDKRPWTPLPPLHLFGSSGPGVMGSLPVPRLARLTFQKNSQAKAQERRGVDGSSVFT